MCRPFRSIRGRFIQGILAWCYSESYINLYIPLKQCLRLIIVYLTFIFISYVVTIMPKPLYFNNLEMQGKPSHARTSIYAEAFLSPFPVQKAALVITVQTKLMTSFCVISLRSFKIYKHSIQIRHVFRMHLYLWNDKTPSVLKTLFLRECTGHNDGRRHVCAHFLDSILSA